MGFENEKQVALSEVELAEGAGVKAVFVPMDEYNNDRDRFLTFFPNGEEEFEAAHALHFSVPVTRDGQKGMLCFVQP